MQVHILSGLIVGGTSIHCITVEERAAASGFGMSSVIQVLSCLIVCDDRKCAKED